MLEKFRYVNHLGEVIDLGSGGIFANYNDLRDYTWSYDLDDYGLASDTYRKPVSKNVPVVFISEDGKTCRENRNRFFSIVEKDAVYGRMGRLYIGEYYLTGFFYSASNAKYLESERRIMTEYKFQIDCHGWRKESTYSFPKTDANDSGKRYPYKYPYRYGSRFANASSFQSESPYPSKCMITFYGPCTDPAVYIAGHLYKINGTLLDGENVVIDGTKQTNSIVKYGEDGTAVNWFAKRYKPESVFEPVPGGVSTISYDGSFAWSLTVMEELSEPKWTYSEDGSGPIDTPIVPDSPTPTPPVVDPEPEQPEEVNGYITSDGYRYVTADGFYYVTAG